MIFFFLAKAKPTKKKKELKINLKKKNTPQARTDWQKHFKGEKNKTEVGHMEKLIYSTSLERMFLTKKNKKLRHSRKHNLNLKNIL